MNRIQPNAPFLFEFAQPCLSPARYVRPSDEYYYDDQLSLVRWRNGADEPPAVIAAGVNPPQTKKNDFEKGEDTKDLSMWR
jgi:hypothetical protein